MGWRENLPKSAAEAAARLDLKLETPQAMGSPSFTVVERNESQLIGALVATLDLEALRSLRSEQKVRLGQVNRTPYPSPEDMAESYANDYGEDLYKRYSSAVQACDEALREVEAKLAAGAAPRITAQELAEARAAVQNEKEAAAAARTAKQEEERRAKEEKEAQIARIVDCAKQAKGGASAATKLLDAPTATCQIAESALAKMIALAEEGDGDALAPVLVAVASHRKLEPTGRVATLLRNLLASGSGNERKWRSALAATLADLMTSSKEAEKVALSAGGNPLLLQAAYDGLRPLVEALLGAYERRAEARGGGGAAEVSARLSALMNRERMTALHMAVRAFGSARDNCLHITSRLAKYIDSELRTAEDRTVWDYISSCQGGALAAALEASIREASSTASAPPRPKSAARCCMAS